MSDASSLSTVDARLERLERQVRSQKRLLVLAMAAVVAAFGAGAAGAAQKTLSFTDAAGHTRLKLDASGVQLYDSGGKRRLFINVDSVGPGLEFIDGSGNARLLVGLSSDGSGIVHTVTTSGKVGTSLEDDKVIVANSSGSTRVYLGTSTGDNGILKIYDTSERERVYAGIFTDGNAGFQSLDTGGTATWTSP